MLDLETLSDEIRDKINEAEVSSYVGKTRSYLGASVLGHECRAYLWFSFRWARKGGEFFQAHILRLFDVGHREEAVCVRSLRQAGWIVDEFDPLTGEQFAFTSLGGHLRGHCDGKAWHPDYPQLETVLLEFKTHNNKSFAAVRDKGVRLSKPTHASQMDLYGYKFELKYGLYYPVSKNDSDIKPELILLDHKAASDTERKADEIIHSQIRPPRVSETDTYFTCKFCSFVGVCHRGDTLDVSCRSCSFASAIEGGWYCNNYRQEIPNDFIPQGCGEWQEVEH